MKNTMIPVKSGKKELRYTAVRKMQESGYLPRSYPSEAVAVAPDASKMLAIMRDLQRNSDIFNSLITWILTMTVGSQGAECLWRDGQKDELEARWRHFVDHADASCRGSFLQLEIWVLTELLVTGECLLTLNDDETIGIIESERVKEVVYNKRGAIQSFIVSNGDKDVSIRSSDCLYVALWKRPSSVRGTPLFAPCVDNINILSAITRSIGLSWHKQAKIPLAVTQEGGVDSLANMNSQSGESTEEREDESPIKDVISLDEATLYIGGKGSSISGINQTVPSSTFSDSVEAMVRLIASSAGLAGDSILNSFGNYSYSSARCAYMQTQGTIRRIQSQLIYSFYRPLVKWLLSRWKDFDVILPPAVPVLDDLADAKARSMRLSLGLTNYEDELLSQNKSRQEHLLQKKREIVDAINIAKEIEAETGYRVNWQSFCGVSVGKVEAAEIAATNSIDAGNE
jgi:capsid protein